MMKIIRLNIGKPKISSYKSKEFLTGIGKESISEALLLKDQFVGDGVANPAFHGGPDRAVCFYPYEHYKQWEEEFNKTLSIPAFGENLTVSGMLEKDICIGDIFQIGDTIVQITQGRVPCSTISKYNSLDSLLKRTVDTCYTGYFARVLKEGMIREDSSIKLIKRHPMQVSVYDTMNALFFGDHVQSMEKIIEVPELADAMRNSFLKKLNKLKV
ncbi:MOSC domain-containing protein [Heyndrickxia oleronia]|uniref:MOSC domain-containing protein n=1 Tax=Heyndrickxia oleronia TaxID=38875 RepID=UPI0020420EA1|nr:MOSC domain-containing protein [Heyndrickxia oleronia]MCM3236682.1 MOSC domain-containing protein [Heyndrickxia oleronia]